MIWLYYYHYILIPPTCESVVITEFWNAQLYNLSIFHLHIPTFLPLFCYCCHIFSVYFFSHILACRCVHCSPWLTRKYTYKTEIYITNFTSGAENLFSFIRWFFFYHTFVKIRKKFTTSDIQKTTQQDKTAAPNILNETKILKTYILRGILFLENRFLLHIHLLNDNFMHFLL